MALTTEALRIFPQATCRVKPPAHDVRGGEFGIVALSTLLTVAYSADDLAEKQIAFTLLVLGWFDLHFQTRHHIRHATLVYE